MSNGLHHVAPASFFPTAKELSSGLQWFKEHPLLAAAAATAVSVITYLNTAEEPVGETEATAKLSGDDDDDEDGAEAPTSFTSARAGTSSSAMSPCRRTSSSANTSARRTAGLATPPALRKPGSEGKMSPAAVSWVDEHGGSLTQVFEHLTIDDDDEPEHDRRAFPNLDGPMRPVSDIAYSHGRSATPRPQSRADNSSDKSCASTLTAGSDETVTTLSSNSTGAHWMGSLVHGGVHSPQQASGAGGIALDRQTESPQWGWYVAITPPQDHVTGGATSASSSSISSASTPGLPPIPPSRPPRLGPSVTASSMRRSTSGRIGAV